MSSREDDDFEWFIGNSRIKRHLGRTPHGARAHHSTHKEDVAPPKIMPSSAVSSKKGMLLEAHETTLVYSAQRMVTENEHEIEDEKALELKRGGKFRKSATPEKYRPWRKNNRRLNAIIASKRRR